MSTKNTVCKGSFYVQQALDFSAADGSIGSVEVYKELGGLLDALTDTRRLVRAYEKNITLAWSALVQGDEEKAMQELSFLAAHAVDLGDVSRHLALTARKVLASV